MHCPRQLGYSEREAFALGALHAKRRAHGTANRFRLGSNARFSNTRLESDRSVDSARLTRHAPHVSYRSSRRSARERIGLARPRSARVNLVVPEHASTRVNLVVPEQASTRTNLYRLAR